MFKAVCWRFVFCWKGLSVIHVFIRWHLLSNDEHELHMVMCHSTEFNKLEKIPQSTRRLKLLLQKEKLLIMSIAISPYATMFSSLFNKCTFLPQSFFQIFPWFSKSWSIQFRHKREIIPDLKLPYSFTGIW